MKIFHNSLVTQGKNEEIFTISRKFLSRNIYFGTEFKKPRKFFAMKVWSYTVPGISNVDSKDSESRTQF